MIVDPRADKTRGVADYEHLSTGVDITATILDYAQLPMMPDMTIARSLKPLVEGKEIKWRDHIVGESFHGQQVAVRDEQYKTILYTNPKITTKVFDLKNDPLEMKNLMDSPELGQSVLQKHKALLIDYLDTVEVYDPPGNAKKKSHTLYLDFYKKLREEA